jgi:hypothetical protein
MRKISIKTKPSWWHSNPLWKIKFALDSFQSLAATIHHLPAKPVAKKHMGSIWNWNLANPDFDYWLAPMAHHADEIILNTVKSLGRMITTHRSEIIKMSAPRTIPNGWRIRCVGALGWLTASFPTNGPDSAILYTFISIVRNPAHYSETAAVFRTINQCWNEFVAAKGLPTEAMKNQTTLHDTVQRAFDCIKKTPGLGGSEIATQIEVTPEHFRSYIVPQLKQQGVYNKNGYQPPPSKM